METHTVKNLKVVYFADPMLSMAVDSIEEEYELYVKHALEAEHLVLPEPTIMDTPPFGKLHYDVLFFDWGGMSMGNDLMGSFIRQIIKEAKEKPNTYYVMVSTFTEYAAKDALDELDEKPHNIFLNIKEFARFYIKYELKQ